MRIKTWDELFLRIARLVSLKSKDLSTQTGCVIVSPYKRILSTGFNGFPEGVIDDFEQVSNRYERPAKYSWTEHCDRNAIYSAAKEGISLLGSTMYLTGPPCDDCTRGIIQAGIVEVIWPTPNDFEENDRANRWSDSFDISQKMMNEAGVKFRRVELSLVSLNL